MIIGDPSAKARYYLSVNEHPFVNGMLLNKNQFWTPSKEVMVSNGKITLNSECRTGDCKEIWNRISAIEIYKIIGISLF